ncbi:hypothetical protein K439DRAFT_1630102 [Ramaria rubella]|nr:hypothetical protein K439DRAFT_1630102 [Ramaria rubella]
MCDAGLTSLDDQFVVKMYGDAQRLYKQSFGANPPPLYMKREDAAAALNHLSTIASHVFFNKFKYTFDTAYTLLKHKLLQSLLCWQHRRR